MLNFLLAILFGSIVPVFAVETEMLPTSALGLAQAAGTPIRVVSGQALVKLNAGIAPEKLDSALETLGAVRDTDMGGGWQAIRFAGGQSVAAMLPILRALPGVAAADPSHVYRPLRAPNDPSISAQYALNQVSAFSGWDWEVGGSSRVTIAVIDAGIDETNAEVSGKLANSVGKKFSPGGIMTDNDPSTGACNHGTRVAGVAAASSDNGLQISGMSWGAQLLSLKVFTDGTCTTDCGDVCYQCCQTTDNSIIAAINYARSIHNTASVGRVVVNMSIGGCGTCPSAVQTAVSSAVAAGVVIVAAAGNSDCSGAVVESPGNCAGVIPVAATDSNNSIASFSSRGTELASSGVSAPGVSILTTDMGGGLANATGTSFSAPMVAGLAALVLSAKPTLTPAEVSAVLRGGADNIGAPAASMGAGRVNAFRSLRLAVNGTLAGFDGQEKPLAIPNPFRTSQAATVTFAIPPTLQGASPGVKIYTLDGRLVRELSGTSWNGKNSEGTPVASGTYIFVVTTSAGTGRGRLAVLR